MHSRELFAGLDIEDHVSAATDPEITGIVHDSRQATPGALFVTWSGDAYDGRAFAIDAVDRGAVAVLADGPPLTPVAKGLRWVIAREPRRLIGTLASRLYRHPDREMSVLGVTGTNGKSTTVALITSMHQAAGVSCGSLGTLGYRLADRTFAGERTTPEASDLFRVLREMRDAGAGAVALEISSHALDQGRVEGLTLDAGVFTNLTRDHLDFHDDLESYFRAKARIAQHLKPGGRLVANVDDSWGRRLAQEVPGAVTFAVEPAGNPMVTVRGAHLDATGIRGSLVGADGSETPFSSPLLGRLNLENILAAAAAAEAVGLPHEAIAAGIVQQGPIAGRLEPVRLGQAFPVLVDYAHTDAALAAVLSSARQFTTRRIAVVFGCGGDRDAGKRPLMGQVAGELSDLPIATSDNPRSEDPLAILRDVEVGLRASGNSAYRVVPDRREAIRGAISVALSDPENWLVLVAGKGHEQEQIVGTTRLPFSDFVEIERALERGGRS